MHAGVDGRAGPRAGSGCTSLHPSPVAWIAEPRRAGPRPLGGLPLHLVTAGSAPTEARLFAILHLVAEARGRELGTGAALSDHRHRALQVRIAAVCPRARHGIPIAPTVRREPSP
jgi:hypothetical protein